MALGTGRAITMVRWTWCDAQVASMAGPVVHD